MREPLPILLLLALPASGKSEVRRFLTTLPPDRMLSEFGLGPTVQVDDFPYVHLMRRISQELTARGVEGPYFLSDALPFREPRDWGTLIELVNEDYANLAAGRRVEPDSAAIWLFDRLDAARDKVGATPALEQLPRALRRELAEALEAEAADLVDRLNDEVVDSLEGRTVVIEFARGGPDGSPMPLPAPYGYRYSLSRLSPEILARASILYIWVTPEESRRKNRERTDPNDPGSILHHGVPSAVMYGDYGCDDVEWLLSCSAGPDTVEVPVGGTVHRLPLGRFDNRVDRTTFVRKDPTQWTDEEIASLRDGLRQAFASLLRGRAS